MEEILSKKQLAKAKIKRFFTYNTGSRPRVWELDFLRGLLMIVVTFDHVLLFGYYWNTLHFYGAVGEFFRDNVFLGYLTSNLRHAVEPFGLWLFAMLAGISSSLTNNAKKRMLKTCAVTAVFMLGYIVLHLIVPHLATGYLIFNILAIISIGTIVEWLMQLTKLPNHARFVFSLVAILIGITYYYTFFVGDGVYVNNGFLSLMVYNEHGFQLSPNNFEPLLPHLGFFMLGSLLGRYVYKERKTVTSHEEPPKIIRPVVYAGKQSLLIYVAGAVVILLPLMLLDVLIGLFY